VCDKVTVLKDGETVKTFKVCEITEKELVKNMVGREMKDYYNRKPHKRGNETLRIEHLSREGQFEDISFTAYAGEILGVAGLIGSGRTEVMEAIFGTRHLDAGQIFINGELVHFTSSAQAINCGLGMVTEDRRRTGLLLDASVLKNMVLPSLVQHMKRGGLINTSWEQEVCTDYIKKLGIKTPNEKTIIKSLSGGNQQKVILAKWLVAQTKILILDEPTRGIDVMAKSEFYALMNEFVAQGGTIIMVSSELPEILGISDRILVMSEGRLAGELSYQEATEEKVMELASLNM
jgi:ABC-type sugar transport system ATPase subunit